MPSVTLESNCFEWNFLGISIQPALRLVLALILLSAPFGISVK